MALPKWVLQPGALFTKCFPSLYTGLLILMLLLLPKLSRSQSRQINYSITKGGDHIGWLNIDENRNGNRTTLQLTSEIKTRIIVPINVYTNESSTYENGQLIFSSISRKTNGNTKLNKQTKWMDDKYEVVENGGKENLHHAFIGINLLSLYLMEPKDIDEVYSDNHECFIKIIKTNDGGYKLKFPDGNSNCYYYKDGICMKIKIVHKFYSANIILSSKN